MKWIVTTPPDGLPIEFGELVKHLRIDARDREYVLSLQRSAVAYAERYLDQSLLARTITATFDRGDFHTCCGDAELALARGPVIEIVSVTDGTDADVAYEQRRVGLSDRLVIHGQTVTAPITVVYRAGHESADTIDADIINAIRVHTATLYSWREDISPSAATKVFNLDAFYAFASANTGIG